GYRMHRILSCWPWLARRVCGYSNTSPPCAVLPIRMAGRGRSTGGGGRRTEMRRRTIYAYRAPPATLQRRLGGRLTLRRLRRRGYERDRTLGVQSLPSGRLAGPSAHRGVIFVRWKRRRRK
ncbi:hypothetical protein B0H14DRAFT_2765117, partial [Mycena olivaceomarginata]